MDAQRLPTGENCELCGKPIMQHRAEVLGQMFNYRMKCTCVLEQEEAKRLELVCKGTPIVREHWRERCGLKKHQQKQSFDTFLAQPGQEEAYRAATGFVRGYLDGGEDKNASWGLLMLGAVGCGKTHLAAAIINAILDERPVSDKAAQEAAQGIVSTGAGGCAHLRFTSLYDLLQLARDAYNGNGPSVSDVVGNYKCAHLLVLDDMGNAKLTDWGLDIVFELIDYRYNEELPTIITSNLTPPELKEVLRDRTFDRIREMCRLVSITAKSQRKTKG